jgi:3-carboxy-cis,cis-muconate cycloisomerase
LLQQALPTTFGLKAAGWLESVLEARIRLAEVRDARLAVQLGGGAGTLAALGERGLEVAEALSAELGLAAPALPWHTARGRVAELAGALALAAGATGKIGLDIALLSQTEVAEVAEPHAPGRGGSSTMPQKRNPVGSILVRACVEGAQAQAGLLLAAMAQEHERAAGAWQSEWPALGEALRFTSGALAGIAGVLEGLTVDERRMRANLKATKGLVMAESVMMALAGKIGRQQAHDLVEEAASATASGDLDFREVLRADARVTAGLKDDEIEAALDPRGYLGAADALIDRALEDHRAQRRAKR